jgi:hypothetical protein
MSCSTSDRPLNQQRDEGGCPGTTTCRRRRRYRRFVTETDPPQAPAISDLRPGSLGWRIQVARCAHRFFNPIEDRRAIAELIGRPHDPNTFEAWSVGDFTKYLPEAGFQSADGSAVARILDAMQRAALLMPAGWDVRMVGFPFVGQLYVSQGGPSARAYQGYLWLSEVLGAELVIESYNAVTALIGGGEGKPVGTGLVLGPYACGYQPPRRRGARRPRHRLRH